MKIALVKLRIRLFLALIAVLSAAWATPSRAATIDYMLSPDVTGSLAGGVTYTVSATFDWNTTTNLESDVNIVLTGPGSYAGIYTADSSFIAEVKSGVPDNQDVCGTDGPDAVCLRFNNALGAVPDSLFGIFASDDPPDLNAPATGVIPGAPPDAAVLAVSPIPEPPSICLLLTGLLACIFVLRRRSQTGLRSL